MLKKIFYTILLCLIFTGTSHADIDNYFCKLKKDISGTYKNGTPNIMIPFLAWHNRLTYDQEHIDRYNEFPLGLGFGLTRYEGYDWHGLYALAFEDSNNYTQTMFGYAYLKNTPINIVEDLLFGYGYTLGLTQRHEYAYIPIPLPLPMLGLTYKNISLNAAYVPGVKNDGNVLFTWLRIDL